ncbi:uncharacterized protein BO88DRAFT_362463 [Aspergillus vadensis CBS 113365]|uniref:Uncharacterized protein n=1 Tax=Aspergillus vadensis (strain CBS 113365 / IMI 142717 / IBT 24658) TaxID=1448311 RepID=A0A319CQF0_ASPVC|nr:hypothetical protein BO88DRAFT_362463 [Aspergillus vadensis CBS 113365]PYH70632.1 hypothetical protein BO88DRAFT_362463 [Aspergillus vadensis CBS 113365]
MGSGDTALRGEYTPFHTLNDDDKPADYSHRTSRSLSRSLKHLVPIVLIYCSLLIFSWTVMCILTHRPLLYHHSTPTWESARQLTCASQTVLGVTDSDANATFSCSQREATKVPLTAAVIAATRRWRLAARVVNSVMAVLTIPFSSFIAARAAIVYGQAAGNERNFSLRKMLAVADRGWWNPFILARLFSAGGRRRLGSPLLYYAFLVCALGGLNWPLQQLLVSEVTILVESLPSKVTPLISDADITGLSQVKSIETVGDTRSLINYATQYDSQPNIWRTPDSVCNSSMSWAYSCVSNSNQGGIATQFYPLRGNSSFVSIPVNSVTTGIISDHAFRFNTSVASEEVSEEGYPDSCGGPGSFSASTLANLSGLDVSYNVPISADGMMEVKVCALGDSQSFPWNLTRNRQDIAEEAYIHFNSVAMSFLTNGSRIASWTQRIRANTTAGYFMLPNYMNNYQTGPLLETFDLAASFDPENFIVDQEESMDVRALDDSHVLGYGYPDPMPVSSPALGPLLTATKALFGPSTFFANRANSTPTLPNITSLSLDECSEPIPFTYLSTTNTKDTTSWRYATLKPCASDTNSTYFNDLAAWLGQLFANYDNPQTTSVFTQGAFFANKANLGRASTEQAYRRILFKDDGTSVEIFAIRPWAIAFLSTIIGLHLVGLVIMAFYAGLHPTWTESFDAFAMLRIGVQLAERKDVRAQMPLLGNAETEDTAILDRTDGVIGEDIDAVETENVGRLVVGGHGQVKKGKRYLVFQ